MSWQTDGRAVTSIDSIQQIVGHTLKRVSREQSSMPTLPFAPTSHCIRCDANADPERYRLTTARSVAFDDITTGNLCEQCYADLEACLQTAPSRDT
jgi:hypothetical protein